MGQLKTIVTMQNYQRCSRLHTCKNVIEHDKNNKLAWIKDGLGALWLISVCSSRFTCLLGQSIFGLSARRQRHPPWR